MKNIIIKTVCVIGLISIVSCKKEANQEQTSVNVTIIQFKEISYDIEEQQNEL